MKTQTDIGARTEDKDLPGYASKENAAHYCKDKIMVTKCLLKAAVAVLFLPLNMIKVVRGKKTESLLLVAYACDTINKEAN